MTIHFCPIIDKVLSKEQEIPSNRNSKKQRERDNCHYEITSTFTLANNQIMAFNNSSIMQLRSLSCDLPYWVVI